MKSYVLEMAQSATESFKIKYGISPEIVPENFACETECHYNLRWCNDFRIAFICMVCHSSESIFRA